MKTCNYPGCNRPRWSNKTGMCQIHTKKKGLQNSGKLKKSFLIGSKKKNSVDTSYGFTSQDEMFEDIWRQSQSSNGSVYSEVSDHEITNLYNTNIWYSCFAHILSKGKYSKYKLNPDNIMLVTPQEHTLIDQGTNKARLEYEEENHCSFNVFYDKKDKLLKQYKD